MVSQAEGPSERAIRAEGGRYPRAIQGVEARRRSANSMMGRRRAISRGRRRGVVAWEGRQATCASIDMGEKRRGRTAAEREFRWWSSELLSFARRKPRSGPLNSRPVARIAGHGSCARSNYSIITIIIAFQSAVGCCDQLCTSDEHIKIFSRPISAHATRTSYSARRTAAMASELTPKFAPFLGMGGIAAAMIFGCMHPAKHERDTYRY